MPTPKRTSSKPKAVAASVAAPVVYKKKSESHVPTASVMWIAVLAIVFSFTGITLSAMAKSSPTQRPQANAFDIKTEVKGIVERLDRIEKKVDGLKAPTATTTK